MRYHLPTLTLLENQQNIIKARKNGRQKTHTYACTFERKNSAAWNGENAASQKIKRRNMRHTETWQSLHIFVVIINSFLPLPQCTVPHQTPFLFHHLFLSVVWVLLSPAIPYISFHFDIFALVDRGTLDSVSCVNIHSECEYNWNTLRIQFRTIINGF